MKAVVFVDVQKDFIYGALRNEKAIEATPKIAEFAKECVEKGYKLYATRDTHEKTVYANIHHLDRAVDNNVPWSGYLTTLEGKKLPIEHCIEGTDGWMIDDKLYEVIDGHVTCINKPTFGSFDLAEIIQEDFTYEKPSDNDGEKFHGEDLEEIIICGFCTDICVVSNALILRAKFPNTKISVKGFLCAGTSDENHDSAIKTMKSCQIDFI